MPGHLVQVRRGQVAIHDRRRVDGVAIAGWTRTLSAPPFVCPHTGAATFRLAATDDGRIAAAERIESAPKPAAGLLSTELVRCAVTGRRVSPELVEVCPISGRRLLRTELVECGSCRQRVSPQVVERNRVRHADD